MIYIRPVKKEDLNALVALAETAHVGLTTLPKDKDYLKKKIDNSLMAFDDKIHKPGGENYLFVLVDSKTNALMGTSGIISKVGGFEPFYTYKIKTERHEDSDLNIKKNIQTLHLVSNHNGPTEICSLFIAPKYRSKGFGRLLSLCRFLFMANFSHRFDENIISELRGVCDDSTGKAPFWECVGKLFFDIEFTRADFLSGLGHKNFIKNLMPRFPIYIPMLPLSVQKVIGEVHEKTRPARYLLEKEGFTFNGEVDIFDAGPSLITSVSKIRTVQKSSTVKVERITNEDFDSQDYLISNTKLDFRACVGKILKKDDASICMHKDLADSLNIEIGETIRFL